jgi:hypothetical protein
MAPMMEQRGRMAFMMRDRCSVVLSMLLISQFTAALAAAAGQEDLPHGHRQITGVVTQKGTTLVLTTPAGATHHMNANLSRRHGHEPFRAGDEVIAELDENNYIVDMHRKGEAGRHQLVTGTLVHVGKTKKEIKLQTAEGEKIFPLAEIGLKTKDLANGSLVTVEVNEAGVVIDLHQADVGAKQP